jgi:hypothetical protein
LATVLVASWAVALVAGASEAGASSCPQANSLLNTGLSGTGGMSYVSGNVSSNDPDGDETQSISVDHRASGMKIVLPKPQQGSGGFGAFGQPTDGTVTINDTFNDTGEANDRDSDLDGESPGQAQQTYSGSNKPSSGDGVTLDVNSSNCTYEIGFGFDVPARTTQSGSAQINQQTGEGDQAQSPPVPIPANLQLSGTSGIHPSFGGNCVAGCYDLSGDPDWGGTLSTIARGGSLPGTATITWRLSPSSGTGGGCVVPRLRGLTSTQAASKLRSAGCALGKVTHQRSSSVPKGRVISSSPKAGTKQRAGTKVAVVLSSG